MDQRLTNDELNIVTAVRPDLAPLWEMVRAGQLDELTPKQQAELLLGKSIVDERNGQFTLAIKCAQQAIACGEAAGWGDLIAGGYACQSSYYYDLGNYALAQAKAWAALERDAQGVPAVISWNALGVCAAESAEMDIEQADDYFHRAAELSRALDYPFGYAMALNWRGQYVYRVRGELDLMLAACNEAARILARLNFPFNGHHYVRAYYDWLKCNRASLTRVLDEMRAIAPRSTFARGALAYYTALLALDDEADAKAEQALGELRAIATTSGHLEMECWVRLATSRYHLLNGEAQSALAWARDAAALARRKASPYLELAGHVACARAALDVGDDSVCEAEMRAATHIAERLGCKLELALLSLLRAVLYQRQGCAEAETAWLETSRRIAQGNFAFMVERERTLAFPLVAAQSRSRNPAVRAAAERMLVQLSNVSPLPLRICGLGRFEVWQGRRRIPDREWQKRRAGELFRFLLLQPRHNAARDLIFEAHCPDQSSESAQTFLHHATSTLRRVLEPDLPDKFPSRYLLVEAEQVELRLPAGSSVDFEEFERGLMARLSPSPPSPLPLGEGRLPLSLQERGQGSEVELSHLLSLYTSDLFPADRYAGWAVDARERLAELHRRGLLALAQQRLADGKPQAALDACRAILASDPWREAAVLVGMKACLALNDRPSALRLYRDLEQALRTDLQIAPRADLQALAAAIRKAAV